MESIRNGKDENLFGNSYGCKRLEVLLAGFAQGLSSLSAISDRLDNLSDSAAAATYNVTLEPLDKKVSKYIGGNPIRVDGKPRASGVMDTVRHFLVSYTLTILTINV